MLGFVRSFVVDVHIRPLDIRQAFQLALQFLCYVMRLS